MRKVVVKLNLYDGKGKQKALKEVSSLQGIESISMDMKDQKLTVIGDMDPVDVVEKIRKHWPTADIVSVGPAKEEKKAEPKKEPEKPKISNEELHKFWNNHFSSPCPAATYHVYSIEENPNACVIC